MKKSLIVISIILLGMVIIYWTSRTTKQAVPQAQAQTTNDLPNMFLQKADGSILEAKQLPGKIILIIYFTDCDHCQREATEISSKLKAFESYDLWFLSTDEFSKIEKFSTDYKLANLANVHFARIQPKDVYSNFGSIPTPSVYIYSESKKLVRAIKGETPIDNIILYL